VKVLVIGGGGREHAICWRLSLSPSVSKVYATPGNPGCARVANLVQPGSYTPSGYLELARQLDIDLTFVGPETPLVDGVVDAFEAVGLRIFGPTRAAAQLEGSKIFSKQFMMRHNVPTARFSATDDPAVARRALDEFTYPLVIKADGLAAGKGVVIVQDKSKAEATLDSMFGGTLVGDAGSRVVIEEFLTGEEVSFIALSDGESVLPFEPSQDHKTIFEGDTGPNTGGMGAYSDSRILPPAMRQSVIDTVMTPTVQGMKAEGMPFKGFLYAGLMMTKDGPKTLEFNVRLGDPETQALLHRLDGDFGELLMEAAAGRLNPSLLGCKPGPSVCVVLAAAGYPGKVRSGDLISGIPEAESTGAVVFHAGTRSAEAGVATSGGRVLGVTHSGATLQEAIANVYTAVDKIAFDGMQIRRDIGRKGLVRW
jgi:phosphoribosylamine--glycine ligase